MTAAENLAAGLLTGIGQADPDLAVALDSPALLDVCGQLAQMLWTPLMLERWGSHPRWIGVTAAEALAELRSLGLPPEAPRSAVPARQDICPEHGAVMRAGVCDWCKASAEGVDHEAGAAAARAALRPLLGSEPPTSPRGIDLTKAERVRA